MTQQPTPATPPATPIPQPNVPPAGPWTPWPDPSPVLPRGPRYAPCCELAAGGDYCDCAASEAEVLAAFQRPAPWGPIVLDLRRAA